MTNSVLQIELPDNVVEEITKLGYPKDIEETVVDLINYALKLPRYFMEFDWNGAESEADFEISSGLTKSFDLVDDFIADLKR
ncbi:MAG: hypothetical protein HQK64_12520 [Desulfamplus sp.]|nr:hypothetical protein [Desulfamplus sp.]MBF0243283.1 hypothetical protein [Desulfamplus sp.]